MATEHVLPISVDPPVDPLMDLESILYLQEDMISPQDDLLSGLLETDKVREMIAQCLSSSSLLKEFLNELLNPQPIPDPLLPVDSLNPSSWPNSGMTAGTSPLQYDTSPDCLNTFTYNAQSSPVSITSSDDRSTPPSHFWTSSDVHIDLEIDEPIVQHYKGDSSSCNRKTGSLTLSEEEKKLLAEEGIHLPTDMPLTKVLAAVCV